MMRTFNRYKAEGHAFASFPRESCGVLIAVGDKEEYFPCRNLSESEGDFIMCPEDYAAAEDLGQIVAVVHSHVNTPARPSEADKVSCEATGVPWHIVSVGKNEAGEYYAHEWHSFEPSGYAAPLVGRSFHHGTLDCYTLIQDFYFRELDIVLPDFYRPHNWWEGESELYLDNFAAAGFVRVDDGPQCGDVILMQNRSKRTNHGGVFLGDRPLKSQPDLHPMAGAMLHHAMPRLSERVLYGGYWQQITRCIVRYKK